MFEKEIKSTLKMSYDGLCESNKSKSQTVEYGDELSGIEPF